MTRMPRLTMTYHLAQSRKRLWSFALGIWWVMAVASEVRADVPNWYSLKDRLLSLFEAGAPLAKVSPYLGYFSLACLGAGFCAVMITAILKVAKARTGEESMGWIASTMVTVALMATGPAIGKSIFSACDDVARSTGYSNNDAITTCWNSLLVILPSGSPVQDVLESANPDPELSDGAPQEKQDATWTKLAWTWMKMAWSTMTDALGKIGGALSEVANRFYVMVLLMIPAATLLVGMVLIKFLMTTRELLHPCLDVFLPLMIALLSFEPTRGTATKFIAKYFSVALWPIAWVLGNSIACSILSNVMQWVVETCHSTLTAIHQSDSGTPLVIGVPTAGYLSGAAAAMPWGLFHLVVFVIFLTSLLVLGSAIGAPWLMSATLSKGIGFASAQIKNVATAFVNTGSRSDAEISVRTIAPAPTATVTTSSIAGGFASRAATSLESAVGHLRPLAANGGPAGMLASMGASTLTHASRVVRRLGGTAALDATDSPVITEAPVPSMTAGTNNTVRRLGVVSRDFRRIQIPQDL